MDGADTPTLTGAFPPALNLLAQIIFRWVPSVVIAVAQTGPGASTSTPLSAWDVPGLLANASSPSTADGLMHAWFIFSVIAIGISVPFLAVVVYCWVRIMQIRRRERLGFEAARNTVKVQDVPRTQLRWNHVLDEANASTPEKWRLAILEADIMLGELLDMRGYKGETMAEKMKQVDRINFNTIDLAWEAHKVRNKIAHEGTAHEISARETRRVIDLYEQVFKEFKYVD